MAANSKIEWCHHTFNPWIGCTKVSPGCANCYAEQSTPARVMRADGHETWGKGATRSLTSEVNWKQPLKWNREAAAAWENWEAAVNARAGDSGPMPQRPRVFCASLADWLDEEVPIEWLARLMELVMMTPHLDWLLLTKRPQNWETRITAALAEVERIKGDWPDRDPETQTGTMLNDWLAGNPPANVWIGTTVEDQARADERIPLLLNIPARVRFLSCEPLLEKVDLHSPHIAVETWRVGESFNGPPPLNGIHWVICGGESGPKARPMHPDWARSLRDQCAAAGVPFFFKQWGEWVPGAIVHELPDHEPKEICRLTVDGARGNSSTQPTGQTMVRVVKKIAGRLLDGSEHNALPKGGHHHA